MKKLDSHLTHFHEKLYLGIFRTSLQKFEVSLKSDKNNGTLREDQCAFTLIYRSVLGKSNISGIVVEKNQIKHCAVNEVLRKKYRSYRQPKDDNKIRRIRLAFWV